MLFAALLWGLSAVVIIRAAWRSRRHPEALRRGQLGFAFLYLAAGAAVNAAILATGEDYAKFADGAYIGFVRHTWHTLVVPHHELWIGLLIAFEASVGLLALSGGKRLQVAYGLAIAFHVALLSFGWGIYAWSLPMIAAFATLLAGERRRARTEFSCGSVERRGATGATSTTAAGLATSTETGIAHGAAHHR